MQQQEKELFGGYEIKNWNLTPRIYKIIAASAALNLFAVFVMAQGSLLTRKGCESPFVSSVCRVLDTVVMGSSLLGTDSELVSKDYQKTELEDAEITYIDVSNDSPPLKYPEGYFAVANPEQFVAQPQDITVETIPGFDNQPSFGGFPAAPPIDSSSSDLLGSKATPPPVNNNPVIGDLPSSVHSTTPIPAYKPPRPYKFPKSVAPKRAKLPNESPADLPNLGGASETAKNKPEKPKTEKTPEAQKPLESEKVADVEINKKPFEDLGDTLIDKQAKKEIDLTKPFSVVLDATINTDGKFDPKKSRFGKTAGDEEMVKMAKLALESVGNSGILAYLKMNGIEKINFTLVQDDKQIYAIIVSDQKTPEKAQTTVSLLNTALQGLLFADSAGLKKLDENSKTLVGNSKVSSEGKNFVFKFNVPKPVGQDLIKRSLEERAQKKAAQPTNSNQVGQNANANTSK
jgi:hypothetical protein